MQNNYQGLPDLAESTHQPQINPYAQDTTTSMFQTTSSFAHPLNYHLYAPVGPHRDNLLPYQRTVHDFFIPDHLREDLQRKSEAVLQTFQNSTLPQHLEHFHSLVALDTNTQKTPSAYGYPSWLYKATSSKDGNAYALRRLEGFRLTDERAVKSVQIWKRITNGSVVAVHDAFTTRAFGDSSLIIVTDYHPLSQTLAEKHFGQASRILNSRSPMPYISEQDLWGYIVQLASALKAVHSSGLAARLMIPQKVLLTSKNRLRLNACGILDITQFEQTRSLAELQQDDLVQLGRLVLCIATKSQTAHHIPQKALEQMSRTHSVKLRQTVSWLMAIPGLPESASQAPADHNVDGFLSLISSQVALAFDASLHEADNLTSNLARELENARLVRLLLKLNMILERPEPSNSSKILHQNQLSGGISLNVASSAWSETGERYYLKLFRDYVFHQVDSDGRPIIDLGHLLGCLNKLDAGIEEKIMLVSTDEQNCFVVSYRELKRGVESAWTDLMKASQGSRR